MKQKDALLLALDCLDKMWNIEHEESKRLKIDYVFSQRSNEISSAKKTIETTLKYLDTF